MALVEQAPEPCLPIEEVPVESLGGEVYVCGMDMPQYLRYTAGLRAGSAPRDGESEHEANLRSGTDAVAVALGFTVLNARKQPLYTAAQWRIWGASHLADAMKLFGVAMRLSGQDTDAERKNS
jgi:hypothetical protein